MLPENKVIYTCTISPLYYFIKSNLIGEREDYNKGTTTLIKFDQIFIDAQLIVEILKTLLITNRFHVAVHLFSNT